MTDKKLRIGLGVITHRRPDGLLRLLDSFGQMKVPENVECTVLLAENDDAPVMETHLDKLRAAIPFEVHFSVEERRGIPFARNRVLDMALEADVDFLTFADDDQVVDHYWLVMLLATMQLRELDLVGGPNYFQRDPEAALSWQSNLVFEHYERAMRQLSSRRASRIQIDSEAEIPIYTNNWMLRISKQRELKTRFDETYRISGGSDTKFYLDFSTAGAVTGWAADARTFEVWPESRLKFRYLFRRSRDQRATNLLRAQDAPTLPWALLSFLSSSFSALGLLLRSPFNDFRSLTSAISRVGGAVGRIRAARGIRSQLYRPSK
ncbi:GT2 family glycosyltransferase [Yoonia maricola]|uniref:GT2 family glycosyltransferase n=1 Tax=Yoonia maricola TaxID=420999 RepID=A0A2M8WKU8_9RHOB|nr:glycosyltransferase family A protein [Yoonia maricola]PJI91562.1 GT2 family glycosyltransferase [Yoonia maricola]